MGTFFSRGDSVWLLDHENAFKLLEFHRQCDSPMSQTLADLDAASQQLPRSAHAAEAQPLEERLEEVQRRRGPQPLADLIPIVLARLQDRSLQSEASEDSGPS